jgi:hypothetical protein
MEIAIETGDLARWYLASDLGPDRLDPLLRSLHVHGIRAIRCFVDSPNCTDDVIRRAMASCSQVVIAREREQAADSPPVQREIAVAASLGIEAQIVPPEPLAADTEPRPALQPQPYAFLAVRIHDDFAPVRLAVVTAVEDVLGIPCLWFDDPRLLTTIPGIRRRTQVAIREASLVIADLTRGPDNPDHDSPNTAHEIGMALAYERPLVLTCRAPRRNLYFSAGDQTTIFWRDEQELNRLLREWLEPRRGTLGIDVWRYEPQPIVMIPPNGPLHMDTALRTLEQMREAPINLKAVWHPLGFIDIDLFSDGTTSLRIHIWPGLPRGRDVAPLTVHRHDWHLDSVVLCGCVRNTVFDVADDARGTHRVFGIEYDGDVNRLVASNRLVRTRLASVDEVHSGQSYSLEAGRFHELTLPDAGVTASIVRAVRAADVRNELLGPITGQNVYITRRLPCDPESLRRAIDAVLIYARRSASAQMTDANRRRSDFHS